MVLDYRERKPVGKNRPRKQPVKSLAVSFVVVAIVAFGAGVMTGRSMIGRVAVPATQAINGLQSEQLQGQMQQTDGQPASARAIAEEPPFTFYETLPKGGQAVIGSGINHKINDPAPVAQIQPSAPKSESMPLPQPQPPVQKSEKQQQQQQSPKPEYVQQSASSRNEPFVSPPQKIPQPQKTMPDKGKFTIQVASCRSRNDAEEIKSRYSTSGVAAYIVESSIPGKGVWYRVRLGKGLDQDKAREMAVKFGKSAIVIPEHEL